MLFADEVFHQGKGVRGVFLVEVAGGFVGKQAIRAVYQRARDCRPLPFAAGEFRRAVVQPFFQADGGQQFARACQRFLRAVAAD